MFSFSPGKREQRRCRLESTLLLSLPAFLLWGAGLSAFLPVFLGLAAIVGGWLFPFFLALFTFRVENAELSWQKGLFCALRLSGLIPGVRTLLFSAPAAEKMGAGPVLPAHSHPNGAAALCPPFLRSGAARPVPGEIR